MITLASASMYPRTLVSYEGIYVVDNIKYILLTDRTFSYLARSMCMCVIKCSPKQLPSWHLISVLRR